MTYRIDVCTQIDQRLNSFEPTLQYGDLNCSVTVVVKHLQFSPCRYKDIDHSHIVESCCCVEWCSQQPVFCIQFGSAPNEQPNHLCVTAQRGSMQRGTHAGELIDVGTFVK